jgi:hypothetical protein
VELVEYQTRTAEAYGFEAEPEPAGAAAGGAAKPPEDDLPF